MSPVQCKSLYTVSDPAESSQCTQRLFRTFQLKGISPSFLFGESTDGPLPRALHPISGSAAMFAAFSISHTGPTPSSGAACISRGFTHTESIAETPLCQEKVTLLKNGWISAGGKHPWSDVWPSPPWMLQFTWFTASATVYPALGRCFADTDPLALWTGRLLNNEAITRGARAGWSQQICTLGLQSYNYPKF